MATPSFIARSNSRVLLNTPTVPAEQSLLLNDSWRPVTYHRGVRLCFEGAPAHGVYRILEGHAKEFFSSKSGKTIILRLAAPGDMIGLEAVLSGTDYGTTVETFEPTKALFIPKHDLLEMMETDLSFRSAIVAQLGGRCQEACAGLRRLVLAPSMCARLAHFVLDWDHQYSKGENATVPMHLTHEEIAQLLGTTRETVSRTFAAFRKDGLVRVCGVQWKICDREALAELATV